MTCENCPNPKFCTVFDTCGEKWKSEQNDLSPPLAKWLPIEAAPNEVELLVGRYVNDEWRVCQSSHCFDHGNEFEGEPAAGWYWSSDWDNGSVTDGDGPTHYMLLPTPPKRNL